ncbi:glutathionylspermidine synthase family protein [Bacillus sp. NPDC077411]|uniref:Glutathionylspermidine synthase family protein n=1 Tax=Bacillus bruguierae TaxID=3127667 RepID=A0ABU8FB44_9BACI
MKTHVDEFNVSVRENSQLAISSFKQLQNKLVKERVLQYYSDKETMIIPKPGLLSGEKLDILSRDTKALLDIIVSLPERIFSGDILKMCTTLGFSEKQYQLMMTTYQNKNLIARSDMYFTKDGYKFLEFNVDSSVGGLDIGYLNKSMRSFEFYKMLKDSEKWDYVDPMDILIENINELAIKIGRNYSDITIAVMDWDEYLDSYYGTLNYIKLRLEEAGYNAIICSQKEAELKDNMLTVNGRKIDILYRAFLCDDALYNPEEVQAIVQASQAGNLELLTGFHTELYGNKGNLVFLSDPYYSHFFTNEELDLVKRCIPWTRFLKDMVTSEDNLEVEGMEYILKNKDKLVIKATIGYGGNEVFLGWKYNENDWEKAVLNLLNSDIVYIVQERVYPLEEEIPFVIEETIDLKKAIMCWGVYIINGGFAGAMLRGLPCEQSDVVNLKNGAAVTCLFYRS